MADDDDLEARLFELVIAQICLSSAEDEASRVAEQDSESSDEEEDDDDGGGKRQRLASGARRRVCVKKSFVRILSGIAENYMTQLGRFTMRLVSRDKQMPVALSDVQRALSSVSPHIMTSIARSRGKLTAPFCHAAVAAQLGSPPPPPPPAAPTAPLPAAVERLELVEQLPETPLGRHPHSAAIPGWLPPFPGKYCYSATPVIPLVDVEPDSFRAAQAKRRRDVEVSLTALCNRIREAFPEELAIARLPKLPADPYAFDLDDAETKQAVQQLGQPVYELRRPTSSQPVRNPCLDAGSLPRSAIMDDQRAATKLLLKDLIQCFKYRDDPIEALHKADRLTYTQILTKTYTHQERARRQQKTDHILNS